MCEHKNQEDASPFLRCVDCLMKICSNCKAEWKDGHACPNSLGVQVGEKIEVKAKMA